MGDEDRHMLHQIQHYRKIVLLYEALDEQIDNLLMAHGGVMENLSPEALARYRELARQRDDVQNEMRTLERELAIDDDGEPEDQPPGSK